MNWGEITHLLSIYHLLPSSWDVQVVETPGVGGRVTVGKVVERFEFFFFMRVVVCFGLLVVGVDGLIKRLRFFQCQMNF